MDGVVAKTRKQIQADYASRNRKAIRIKNNAWRKANMDRARVASAKYAKAHPEKVRERKNAWNRRHPEKARVRMAKWKEANQEKYLASQAKYREDNVGKVRAYQVTRRAASKLATPQWANRFFMSEAYRLAKLRTKVMGYRWTVDHIVPIQSPLVCGLHVENNLRVIPDIDNKRKGNRHWPDMP